MEYKVTRLACSLNSACQIYRCSCVLVFVILDPLYVWPLILLNTIAAFHGVFSIQHEQWSL